MYAEHQNTDGPGVVADGMGSNFAGVLGRNSTGVGVQGTGMNGVYGESATGDGWGAVVGRSTGQGGIGTYRECSGGTGVKGVSTSGYAGVFKGGKAQLRLLPGDSVGKPSTETHSQGEIYMALEGALWVCTAGDGTTVGTWKKVTMTTVVD